MLTIDLVAHAVFDFIPCFGWQRASTPSCEHKRTWSHSRTTSRVLAPSGGQSSLTFGLRPIPKAAPEVAAAVVAAAAADETSVVNVNEPKTFVNPDVIPTVVSGK